MGTLSGLIRSSLQKVPNYAPIAWSGAQKSWVLADCHWSQDTQWSFSIEKEPFWQQTLG
jgi:hypothetical protein